MSDEIKVWAKIVGGVIGIVLTKNPKWSPVG